jgi:hypothetical protein
MAQKLQLLKLLQEIRGYAELGSRQIEPRFLPLPSPALRIRNHPTPLGKRRFSIPVRQDATKDQPVTVPIKVSASQTAPAEPVLKIKVKRIRKSISR